MGSQMRDLNQQLMKFNYDQNFQDDDFYISKSNEHVYNLIKQWPKWNKKFLNISGEKSSGKTHLINIFIKKFKGIKINAKLLDNENFEFIPLKHNTITPYKKHIKYESGKFKGKRYNKVNLNDLKEEDFTKLLELHGADFIVFITWYEIKKESFVRAGEHRKRVDYAGHYFDYDVFNLFKQRVIGEGRVKIKASEPNDEQASYSLLRTKELEELYQNFATHIIEQVSKPIE